MVYSITARSTFDRVERIVERVHRVKDDSSGYAYGASAPPLQSPTSPTHQHHASLSGGPGKRLPIVIVGNKRDMFSQREVSTEEARGLAQRLGCDFFEASAKTNTNVEAAFKSLVRQIKANKRGGAEGGHVAGDKKKNKKKAKCVIL